METVKHYYIVENQEKYFVADKQGARLIHLLRLLGLCVGYHITTIIDDNGFGGISS